MNQPYQTWLCLKRTVFLQQVEERKTARTKTTHHHIHTHTHTPTHTHTQTNQTKNTNLKSRVLFPMHAWLHFQLKILMCWWGLPGLDRSTQHHVSALTELTASRGLNWSRRFSGRSEHGPLVTGDIDSGKTRAALNTYCCCVQSCSPVIRSYRNWV